MRQTKRETTIWLLAAGSVLTAAALLAGCATQATGTAPGKGTAVGAGTGALLGTGAGMIAGNNIDGLTKTEGAIAGALIGGLLGGVMGNQQDAMVRQNESVNQRLNSVEAQANTTVVQIQNSNGSMTPVVLHRSGNQWIGPRGESYSNLPTEAQLKPVYGF
jgi:hypothetical protein